MKQRRAKPEMAEFVAECEFGDDAVERSTRLRCEIAQPGYRKYLLIGDAQFVPYWNMADYKLVLDGRLRSW